MTVVAAQLSESDRAWWLRAEEYADEPDPKAHEKLSSVINTIERDQPRKRDWLLWGAMYAGGIPPAGGGMAVDAYVRTTPGNRGNMSLNVSRNVVDAVASRVFAKSRPHLSYVTEGGGFEKQDNAKKLELGVEGVFYTEKGYAAFQRAGRDGCVFGDGWTKIHAGYRLETGYCERKVHIERWMPWEVRIDDGEAHYGEPRNLYTIRYWDKDVLKALWRDDEVKRFEIERLRGERDEDAELGYQQVAQRLRVEEAWHRPSGPGMPDGRHVMAIHTCTLIDEPWDGGPPGRPWLFAKFSWNDPIIGIPGQGIVELGSGLQAEINKLVREIQNGHHLIKGHWLVAMGSGVLKQHINNDLSRIIQHQPGMEPKYVPQAIIAPEVYTHLWNLVERYYRLAGVNEQTASASKPSGLNSGEAQREYRDSQSETLLENSARYDDYVRECGHLVVDAAQLLAKTGTYEVRALADDGFETIDWAKLDDVEGYELKVMPTSSLPSTPSARVQLAYDLMQIGDYDAQDIMEIIGMSSDVTQKTRLKQASRRLVEKKVGEMLRDGVMYHAHPFLNLDEATIIATQLLNNADEKGVEDWKLDLVRQFINECVTKPWAQQPAPAAPQAVAPNAPMLGPGQAGAQQMGTPPPVQAGGPPAPAQGMAA